MDPSFSYSDNHAWLVKFYQKHNPKKLHLVDQTLETYRGKEHILSAVRLDVLVEGLVATILFSF